MQNQTRNNKMLHTDKIYFSDNNLIETDKK